MHHVTVAFDGELLVRVHGADFRDDPYVVSTEIKKHEVLCEFLRVGEQVFFKLIRRFVAATSIFLERLQHAVPAIANDHGRIGSKGS